jgi:hypothetical protein
VNWKKLTFNQEYVAYLLLVAMVTWFCHEMVWGAKIPFFRDLGLYFYPIRFILAQSFQAGELPLWNRHMGMGFPLLADFQSGVFYPPHLFFLIFPFSIAIGFIYLFHYLVAAIGSYKLLRHWECPSFLALTGSIIFTFGGTIVSLTNLLNHFQTAVWLPWVLFLGERTIREQSWKNFLLFTLGLLVQFLAGSPELYIMSIALFFLDALRIQRAGGNASFDRIFFVVVAANTLAVGLAMVQILPTMELFLESRGNEPIAYGESALWSLRPLNLINLFFLDKEVNTAAGSGMHLFFLQDTPLLVSHYMGTISLFGICLWFFQESRKEKAILLGLIVFSLILAVGGYTPVYALLFYYVPFLSLFRFPEKFFFLTNALLFFVSLRGLLRFIQSDDSSSKGPFIMVLLMDSILVLFYLFLRFDTVPLSRFIAWATHTPLLSTETLGRTAAVLVNLERQIALAFGITVLLFAWKKGKLRTTLFQGLLVGLVFFDLTSAHRPYQYLVDPGVIYRSPRILTAPDPEPARLFYYPGDSNLHPSYYRILRQLTFPELPPLFFSNLLPNTGVFQGFDYMQEIDALRRWQYIFFLGFAKRLPPERLHRLLGVLNVKYIITFQTFPEEGITLLQHFPEHPSWLYKLNRTIPRVYIVQRAVGEKDPSKVLDQLSSLNFNPSKEVILDEPLSIASKNSFQAEAGITSYTNHHVVIHASLNRSGVLVLADSYYPGWRVFVDGREGELLRANFFFRAVFLSAGDHVVEFRYQPWSFTLGLIISLAFLSGVIIWSIVLFVMRKQK